MMGDEKMNRKTCSFHLIIFNENLSNQHKKKAKANSKYIKQMRERDRERERWKSERENRNIIKKYSRIKIEI